MSNNSKIWKEESDHYGRKIWSRQDDGTLCVVHEGMSDRNFEIVDSVPRNYVIWPIGENMPDGWIPFCKTLEGYTIDPTTLKAMRFDGAQTILDAMGYFHGDIEAAKQSVARSKPNDIIRCKIEKAIPLLEKLGYKEHQRI